MIRHLPAVLLWAMTVPLPVQGQQKVALTRPEAEFAEPFTQVSGVRELPGGRVLVSDIRDKIVQLVDFATGAATAIGREGQGPEEYLMPSGLYPLPDGGALLQDFGNRRFLTIGPDGKIGKAIAPPQPPAPTEGAARGGAFLIGALIDARAADGRGNLYFQGLALPGGPGGEKVDSIPIMRWDRARSVDTVAWLPVTETMRPQVARSGNAMSVRIGGNRAWSSQVQWGVAADGRIALVEPEPYRVTWVQGRGRATGPAVVTSPIRVTEADKKEYREQMSRTRPVMMTFGGPGGRTAAPPPSVSATQDDPEWPETKPVFSGRQAVLVTPEGEVFVERLRKAGDLVPVYDVFDGAGRLSRQITLRPRSRVVGFGKGTVYVTRSDEDDLQYLERYRWPQAVSGKR
jgi:hypothetical protein